MTKFYSFGDSLDTSLIRVDTITNFSISNSKVSYNFKKAHPNKLDSVDELIATIPFGVTANGNTIIHRMRIPFTREMFDTLTYSKYTPEESVAVFDLAGRIASNELTTADYFENEKLYHLMQQATRLLDPEDAVFLKVLIQEYNHKDDNTTTRDFESIREIREKPMPDENHHDWLRRHESEQWAKGVIDHMDCVESGISKKVADRYFRAIRTRLNSKMLLDRLITNNIYSKKIADIATQELFHKIEFDSYEL